MPAFIWMSVCIWQHKYLAISESACDFTQMDWLMSWLDAADDKPRRYRSNFPVTSKRQLGGQRQQPAIPLKKRISRNTSGISWQLWGINKIWSLNYYHFTFMNHGIKAFTSKVHINCRVSYVCNLQEFQLKYQLISQRAFTLGNLPPPLSFL